MIWKIEFLAKLGEIRGRYCDNICPKSVDNHKNSDQGIELVKNISADSFVSRHKSCHGLQLNADMIPSKSARLLYQIHFPD